MPRSKAKQLEIKHCPYHHKIATYTYPNTLCFHLIRFHSLWDNLIFQIFNTLAPLSIYICYDHEPPKYYVCKYQYNRNQKNYKKPCNKSNTELVKTELTSADTCQRNYCTTSTLSPWTFATSLGITLMVILDPLLPQ